MTKKGSFIPNVFLPFALSGHEIYVVLKRRENFITNNFTIATFFHQKKDRIIRNVPASLMTNK